MAAQGDKNAVAGDFFSAELSIKDWRSGKEKLVEVMYVCKAVNFRIQAANTFNKRHEAQQRKVFYFKRCTRPLNNEYPSVD